MSTNEYALQSNMNNWRCYLFSRCENVTGKYCTRMAISRENRFHVNGFTEFVSVRTLSKQKVGEISCKSESVQATRMETWLCYKITALRLRTWKIYFCSAISRFFVAISVSTHIIFSRSVSQLKRKRRFVNICSKRNKEWFYDALPLVRSVRLVPHTKRIHNECSIQYVLCF